MLCFFFRCLSWSAHHSFWSSQHSELYRQFPFLVGNYHYASLGLPRIYLHNFSSQGYGSALLLWRCSMIPFHARFISGSRWQDQHSSWVMMLSRMSLKQQQWHIHECLIVLLCQQSRNPSQTFQCPSLIFFCTALCPLPSYTMISLIVILSSYLLQSMVAALGQPLQGRLVMSLLLSLKCFNQCHIPTGTHARIFTDMTK